MQLHELEAWLGDHKLTSDQQNELLAHANELEKQYPDLDDRPERDAALSVACELMTKDEDHMGHVVEALGNELAALRQAELNTLAGLKQAALILISAGEFSEAGFARTAGVDRMTVRKWLGKQT